MAKTYNGRPCKNCSNTVKYTSTQSCVLCTRRHTKKWVENNKEKDLEYRKQWNKDHRQQGKAWRDRNKIKLNARARELYKERPEINKAKFKKLTDSGYAAASSAKRRALKLEATPPWVNQREIQGFYEMCARVSKCLGIKHHVDHIEPLKGKKSRGLNVPWNLRVVPAYVNLSKGNRLPNEHSISAL